MKTKEQFQREKQLERSFKIELQRLLFKYNATLSLESDVTEEVAYPSLFLTVSRPGLEDFYFFEFPKKELGVMPGVWEIDLSNEFDGLIPGGNKCTLIK